MEGDGPSTPSSAGPAAGILRPPSADLALETTPEDDPMVEHMHLHVSPSRGEVHAHGRWHKYVKPRIGPGFQVKADAIPEVGDGLMGEGERGDGQQQQQQQRGKGGGGGSSMSRDSSAADLSSAAEEQGSTGRQQRRSGRSSAGSRRGSRSSSGRSTPTSSSNGNEPDEQREFFSFIIFFIQSIKIYLHS